MDAHIKEAATEPSLNLTDAEKEEIVNNTMEAFSSFLDNGVLEDAEGIMGTLLQLEDDKFKVIAPFFLDQMEQTFNSSNTSLLLTISANQEGLKYEDLVEAYDKLIGEIDTAIDDETLSPIKKDFIKQIFGKVLNVISNNQLVGRRIIKTPIKLSVDAKAPKYAHPTDAAMDLYSTEDCEIGPNEQVIIHTGIQIAIPKGYALLIQPRSGLSSKSKLRIANTPGLIDSGYRGEICVIMENIDPKIKDLVIDDDGKATGVLYGSSYKIEKGDRIAQARLVEVPMVAWNEVNNIFEYESDRGEGGFGSTGTK